MLAIRQLLNALHVMISLLMSPRNVKPDIIDRHIKIFLSCCDRFSKSYYERGTDAFWANTGNFPSLLDLAAQIECMESLRWYWEGSNERFIQTVKTVLISMRKNASYFKKKLALIQKLNVLKWIGKNIRKRRKTIIDRFLRGS